VSRGAGRGGSGEGDGMGGEEKGKRRWKGAGHRAHLLDETALALEDAAAPRGFGLLLGGESLEGLPLLDLRLRRPAHARCRLCVPAVRGGREEKEHVRI